MKTNAVRINAKDNVVVAIEEIKTGDPVIAAGTVEVKANEDIMRNHKVAVAEIPADSPVLKYGEAIGLASVPIHCGDWVHTKNLKSKDE